MKDNLYYNRRIAEVQTVLHYLMGVQRNLLSCTWNWSSSSLIAIAESAANGVSFGVTPDPSTVGFVSKIFSCSQEVSIN